MKINVAVVLRLEDKTIREFDNVTEVIEEIETVKESLLKNNELFENKYRLDVTFQVKDGSFWLPEYSSSERMLIRLEELEYDSRNLNDLGDLFNDLTNKDEIPFLNDIFKNDWDILESCFESKEKAVKAVYFGKYSFNDDYVHFNGYGNLESLNTIPYEDYQDEIFNQWLDENL